MRFVIELLCFAAVELTATTWLMAGQKDADKPGQPTEKKENVVQATYLITGLHCPPCTTTVEQSLRRTPGIRSVKVDWRTHNARIEFDENAVSAQKVALLVNRTPHMMGGGMRYGGWLSLRVTGVKDEATAKKAKETLAGIKGVTSVVVYPAQEAVGIAFSDSGEITTKQLIQSLADTGLAATSIP